MRELGQVFESARLSAPPRHFPDRRQLVPWDDLDRRVRDELTWINENLLSVVRGGRSLLLSYQRVINDFNHGLRSRLQDLTGASAEDYSDDPTRQSAFRAGQALDERIDGALIANPRLALQFLTATRLLGHEFGELNFALHAPYEFVLRHVSPEHGNALGELATALPQLFEYREDLLRRILADADFSWSAYCADIGPAPSHPQYVTLGTVALFDPDPTGWRRVGAHMGLALTPFIDRAAVDPETARVPLAAVRSVSRRPMAAWQVVRRQMERIELAREWTGLQTPWIDIDAVDEPQATLYDVWQMTTASRIRAHDSYLVDLVADTVTRSAGEHLEETTPAGTSRLAHLRRQLPAFIRGFDARYEGVVDPRALESAGIGRAMSEGLRRFEGGGLLIGAISNNLGELCEVLNKVHHASVSPGAHVLAHLARIQESSPTAQRLLELFELRPSLLRDLFERREDEAFHAMADTLVGTPYDLLRGALFSVLRGVGRGVLTADKRELQLVQARRLLERIPHELPASTPRAARGPTLTQRSGDALDGPVRTAAEQFAGEFDALVRTLRQLWLPLQLAERLQAPRSPTA